MPKAKLKEKNAPRKLVIAGLVFVRGADWETIPLEKALVLMECRHLDVLLDDVTHAEVQKAAEAAAFAGTRPEDMDEIFVAIQIAARRLDPGDPSNYTQDDKPQVASLVKVLGYRISEEERDAALGYDDPDWVELEVELPPNPVTNKGGVKATIKAKDGKVRLPAMKKIEQPEVVVEVV